MHKMESKRMQRLTSRPLKSKNHVGISVDLVSVSIDIEKQARHKKSKNIARKNKAIKYLEPIVHQLVEDSKNGVKLPLSTIKEKYQLSKTRTAVIRGLLSNIQYFDIQDSINNCTNTPIQGFNVLQGENELEDSATAASNETRLADIRQRKEIQRTERTNSVIADGFVYLIISPAYPGWIKVGQTSDYVSRLATYQTASPHSDYQMIHIQYVANRINAEKLMFDVLHHFPRKGEWFEVGATNISEFIK